MQMSEEPVISGEGYSLSWQKVNVTAIDKALRSSGVRSINLCSGPLYDALYWIRQRAVKVRGHIGMIPVISWSTSPPGGKLQGRIFTGIGKTKDEIPPPIMREIHSGVPEEFVGKSPFAFSKAVRCVCRAGLNLIDMDIVCSYLSHMRLHLGKQFPRTLAFYIENRDRVHRRVQELLAGLLRVEVDADAVKNLFTRIGFLGSLDSWCREFYPDQIERLGDIGEQHPLNYVYQFEDAAEVMLEHLAARHPELLKDCQDRLATMAFHVYAHMERKTLAKLVEVAMTFRCDWSSKEHDGLVAPEIQGLFEAAQAAVAPLKLALKPVPDDPFAVCKAKFGHLDFSVKSITSLPLYHKLLTESRNAIRTNRASANTTILAECIAARLDGRVVVPACDGEKRLHFEMYGSTGWGFFNASDMRCIAAEHLRDMALPCYRPSWKTDAPEVPEPLNKTSFAAALVDHILSTIAKCSSSINAQPVDGASTRYKILFKDGKLYDFVTGNLRAVTPGDRMGWTLPFSYTPFKPPNPAEAKAVFSEIKALYRAKRDVGEDLHERLDALAEDIPVLKVMRAAQEDWSTVLYVVRMFVRAVVADARYCEFLYIYGNASGGKDVLLLIFLHFFGRNKNNYGYMLSGSFLAHSKVQTGRESASPFLAETQGKRFVWCSEIPAHDNLDLTLIKSYCEQSTPVTARRLYRAPTLFEPMGLLATTSNYPPRTKVDDGFVRRNRVLCTSKIFGDPEDYPGNPNVVPSDPTLKARILSGTFNAQLFYLAVMLVDTLSADVCPGTNIIPLPETVSEFHVIAKNDLTEQTVKEPEAWIREKCVACKRSEATLSTKFKADMAQALDMSAMALEPILKRVGVFTQTNSVGARIVCWNWGSDDSKKPAPGLRLK